MTFLSPEIILAIFVGIILFGFFIIIFRRKPKLSASNYQKYSKKILATSSLDPAHAVMESHKLFVAAISTVVSDRQLTAAQKVSKFSKQFPNEKKIWEFHRLRNRLAHETDIQVSASQAEMVRKEFLRALKVISIAISK